MEQIVEFILIIPVILLSLAIHEYSHGKAADMLGDPTPRMMGRLTLNPIAHLDPIGALVLLITRRFGWAKPVPINPRNFHNPSRDIMIVSLAGPGSNILLAFVLSLVFRFLVGGIQSGFIPYSTGNFTYFFLLMVNVGITLNLALAIFNLLPVPPLDGSKILRGILPYRWMHFLDILEGPYGFMLILLLLYTGIISSILFPIINSIRNLLLMGI